MNIDQARNMLRINRHRLDDELEINAQTGEEIGRETAKRNSRQLEAKKTLDQTEARVVAELREDDAKLGVAAAEKEARRHRDVVAAWNAYAVARQEHEEWEVVYKAWIGRGHDLKALGLLFANQYFAIDSIRGPYPSNTESLRAGMRGKTGDFSTRRSAPEEEPPPRPRRRSLVDS